MILSPDLQVQDITVEEFSPEYDASVFDCEDQDLNGFLKEDAQRYQGQLIAKTYLLLYQKKIVAFFSIMNDSIKLDVTETAKTSDLERLHEYPAIKIGRLGVDKSFKRKGIGRYVVGYVIGLARMVNATSACRFVTVDSYQESILFYEKLEFIRNKMYEKKRDFVSLRFDLLKGSLH